MSFSSSLGQVYFILVLQSYAVDLADIKTVTNDQQTVFFVSELDFTVDLPSTGSWVLVQVTHIFSPSHVCVVFPYGPKTYSELLESGTQFADGLHLSLTSLKFARFFSIRLSRIWHTRILC